VKYGVFLLALLCSSCVYLSKQNHLSIDEPSATISNSFCGSLSYEWKKFGTGNLAEVSNEDIGVSFCSTPHYSKIVAKGFIFPFVPTDGYLYASERWVQIKNTHATYVLGIKKDFLPSDEMAIASKICTEQKLRSQCLSLADLGSTAIQLKPGETIWVPLPERDALTVTLYSGAKAFEYQFIEVNARSWWMLTV